MPTSTGSAQRVAERRLDVRYVGPVSGCYTLSQHRDIETGGIEVFACRTQSISASAAAITAPVVGKPGESLTARFNDVGIVRGTILRPIPDGFVFEIAASDQERAKLAARIDWLKKRSVRKEEDHREFKRFEPRDPRSVILLENGEAIRCFVIDISRGGAAVSCRHVPRMGEKVMLGRLACHVVRKLPVGFAVQYDIPQDAEGLEQLIVAADPAGQPSQA